MTTNLANKLKIITSIHPGHPIDMMELERFGISRDLAVYYCKSGWLVRLEPGVYMRPGDLDQTASLNFLAKKIQGLHIGGRCALSMYGYKQYVRFQEPLDLYGWDSAQIPSWFTSKFPGNYKRKRLFPGMNYVSRFSGDGPMTSEPERAFLEMLSDVGIRVNIEEAFDIGELTFTFRSDVVHELIKTCLSKKPVKLCKGLAISKGLPYDFIFKEAT